jgi:hypothetical protein
MIKPNVLLVLLDPCFKGIPTLFSVGLPTLAGDALNAWFLQTEVIFDGLKGNGDLLR